METTTTTAQTTPKRTGCHAVLVNNSNETKTIQANTRTDLAKMLSEQFSDWKVLAAYKGRQLEIKEKKRFNFS